MAPGPTISSPHRFQQLAVPVFYASLIDWLVAWERLEGEVRGGSICWLDSDAINHIAWKKYFRGGLYGESSKFTIKCSGEKKLWFSLKSIATKPESRLLQQNYRLENTEISFHAQQMKNCKWQRKCGMAWRMNEAEPSMRFLAPVQFLLLASDHPLWNLFDQSWLSIVDGLTLLWSHFWSFLQKQSLLLTHNTCNFTVSQYLLLTAHAPTALVLVLFFLSILWPPAHFLGLTDTLWTAHALVPSSFSPFPLPSSLLLLTVHSFYAAPVRSCHFLQSADYLTADIGVFDHFLLQILEPRAFLIMMMLQAPLVLNKVQLGVLLCQGSRILLLADIPAQTWPGHLFSTVQSLLHVFAVSSLSWIHWWHLVNVQVFCQTDINICCSNSSFFFLAAQAK